MTFQHNPHPLLDLSPQEQDLLLRADRDQLRIVGFREGPALRHLVELKLLELHDGLWVLTRGRGDLVAYYLERLETAREIRRSPSAPEKKAVVQAGLEQTIRQLTAEICALP